MTPWKRLLATLACTGFTALSHAELKIGVTLSLTGPASGLGIPMQNALKLWPQTIAGQRVTLIVHDDATDPTKGVQNVRRFVSEEKVDLVLGSSTTPVAIAIADVAAESRTVQLSLSPAVLPAGRDAWTFRIPHANAVMATAVVGHMKKHGVKTVGFLGYTDAYGEVWLQDMRARLESAAIRLVGVERFARPDTSVTGQAIKLAAANPDAILVVASGSGAAMPHLALLDRGYKGRVYQTHAAATRDLMRVGGKAVNGAYVSSAAAIVAEQLPPDHRLKAAAMRFATTYDKAYGPGSRNALAAHGWDAYLILEKVLPAALKLARPGTPAFRVALKEALESTRDIVVTGGVLNYTPQDHWGYGENDGEIMKIVADDWKLEP